MARRRGAWFLGASIVAALAPLGCGGGTAPSAEILDATPSEIDPSRDAKNDLLIRVRYADPSGDLGGGRAEIHDCRGAVTTLAIPPIASEEAVGAGVAIEGELKLLVADIGANVVGGASSVCASAGPSDQVPFCVVLEDAAGERSDGVCTPPIRILASP